LVTEPAGGYRPLVPYKSKAQARFMHAAADRGEVSKKVVDEFDKATKKAKKKLPERKAKKAKK